MIGSSINQQIAKALKEKDEVRLSTLRLLSSAFNYERIAKQHELTEEEEFAVVRREAKKRRDAIESLKVAMNRRSTSDEATIKTRLKREEEELNILEKYLPVQINDEELEKLVEEAITQTSAESIRDMGKVIGVVMQKTGGSADGKKVAEMVKAKLPN